MELHLLQLVSLVYIGRCAKRPKQLQWHLECSQAIQLLSRVGNAGSVCVSMDIYIGLVVITCNC